MAIIQVVTGIIVEETLLILPRNTIVSSPICVTNPDDCCEEIEPGTGTSLGTGTGTSEDCCLPEVFCLSFGGQFDGYIATMTYDPVIDLWRGEMTRENPFGVTFLITIGCIFNLSHTQVIGFVLSGYEVLSAGIYATSINNCIDVANGILTFEGEEIGLTAEMVDCSFDSGPCTYLNCGDCAMPPRILVDVWGLEDGSCNNCYTSNGQRTLTHRDPIEINDSNCIWESEPFIQGCVEQEQTIYLTWIEPNGPWILSVPTGVGIIGGTLVGSWTCEGTNFFTFPQNLGGYCTANNFGASVTVSCSSGTGSETGSGTGTGTGQPIDEGCTWCSGDTPAEWYGAFTGFGGECSPFNTNWTLLQPDAVEQPCYWEYETIQGGNTVTAQLYFTGNKLQLILSINGFVKAVYSTAWTVPATCCGTEYVLTRESSVCISSPVTVSFTSSC